MRKLAALALLVFLGGCASSGGGGSSSGDAGTEDGGSADTVWREPSGSRTTEPAKTDQGSSSAKTAKTEPTKTPGAGTVKTTPEKQEPGKTNNSQPKSTDPGPQAAKDPQPKATQPKDPQPKATEPTPPVKPDTVDRNKLAEEFELAVLDLLGDLEESKAAKFFVQERKKFQDEYDKTLKLKADSKTKQDKLERAWADTIRTWYEARYAAQLFLHLHSPAKDFVAVFVHERADVLTLSDAQLASADCRYTQAANEFISREGESLRKFQADALKNDLVANKVNGSENWKKTWKAAHEKWERGSNGDFDADDLKKHGR
ncbi:MAG: hypothetical protein IT463_07425 [Planctomycetes bacterium]|nr:hypothetical protein [Planctomycetota bacterium]